MEKRIDPDSNLSGDWARDDYRSGYGGDWARDADERARRAEEEEKKERPEGLGKASE